VTFKIVQPSVHPHEASIGTFLSSEALAGDPHNHCIPTYEVLKVPDDDDMIIIVMPILRSWDSPHLETIGAAVDMLTQLFEVRNIIIFTQASSLTPSLSGLAIHA
jgi:hypothetical protein